MHATFIRWRIACPKPELSVIRAAEMGHHSDSEDWFRSTDCDHRLSLFLRAFQCSLIKRIAPALCLDNNPVSARSLTYEVGVGLSLKDGQQLISINIKVNEPRHCKYCLCECLSHCQPKKVRDCALLRRIKPEVRFRAPDLSIPIIAEIREKNGCSIHHFEQRVLSILNQMKKSCPPHRNC